MINVQILQLARPVFLVTLKLRVANVFLAQDCMEQVVHIAHTLHVLFAKQVSDTSLTIHQVDFLSINFS